MAETETKTRRATPVLWAWQRENRTYGGRPIHKGQAIELRGLPLDEKLKSLGYFEKVAKGAELSQCLRCGGQFVGSEYLQRHQDDCPEMEIDLSDLKVDEEVT